MSAISIPIISDFDSKGIDRAVREFSKLETTGQKAQFAISKAAVPAAAALGVLADFGGQAVKAFMEDDKAAQLLKTTLKNTTGATDDQVAAVEKFISKTSIAAAVSDDELRPALDSLVRGTGDVAKAQELMGLALDVSAGTGKDLGSVSDALAKAFNGQLGPLKKLDPALADLIKSGASTDEVFAALSKTFKGQASVSANTASGKMKSFGIQMNEFKESVGAAVMPIINKLLPAFTKIGNWISSHVNLIVTLGLVVGGIAAAIWLTNAALTAWNALQAVTAAINAVTTASFTALWVATGAIVILAVVAALVALQVKFNIFGKAIKGIKAGFDILWGAVKFVFDWIKDHWELLLAIITGPFGLAALFVIKFKDQIIGFFQNIISWITDNWKLILAIITGPLSLAALFVIKFKDDIIGFFGAIISWVTDHWKTILAVITGPFGLAFSAILFFKDSVIGVFDGLKNLAGKIFDGIGGAFKGVINAVISGLEGGLNFAIKGLNTILDGIDVAAGPFINFGTIPNVHLPRLAEGGIVTSPTIAMIGEGNGPEAVIPLSKLGQFGGGGANITVNVNGGDPDSIVRALQQWVRNNGTLQIATTSSVRF
jgi:hypothetical protein